MRLRQQGILSPSQEEKAMPTFDLTLPPQAYSTWRPARPVSFGLIARWIERTRQRQALATLDDRILRDIGITRVEAARECEKPFWR
jgi:uncharacterized protein YjiS (DUF1127 family)